MGFRQGTAHGLKLRFERVLGRARLQPCRPGPGRMRTLAPEGRALRAVKSIYETSSKMKLQRPGCRLVHLLMLCLAFCGFLQAQLKAPSLISFNPTQAGAGTTVTITFSGMNFVPRAMNLVFSPAQGITVSSLQVLSPNQISPQGKLATRQQH